MDKNNKQFGLILPKSKQGASSNAKKPVANIFKQDSSSEDDETKAVVSGGTDWMKRKIASGATVNAKSGATGLGTKITSHHVLMKQKALEEDPTIFQVCIFRPISNPEFQFSKTEKSFSPILRLGKK